MNEEQTLLLKVGGEGGFVEILQDSNGSFIYHYDQSSYKDFLPHDRNEIDKDFYTLDTLQEAIGRINLSLLEYITPNVPLVSLTNVPDISLLNVPLFTGCN